MSRPGHPRLDAAGQVVRSTTARTKVPRRQSATSTRFRRRQTTAQGVVAALALPPPPSPLPRRPLPLTCLHQLPRDASMLYDIAQVDDSGRVGSQIIAALDWQPRHGLELILVGSAIVLRASPDGLISVPPRPRIIIPATARRRHAIKIGDHVLLAAAPEYGTLIVYPISALDDMIAAYHLAHPAEEKHQHE